MSWNLPQTRRGKVILLAWMFSLLALSGLASPPLLFNGGSSAYGLKHSTLDGSENVTIETWLKLDADCPPGARIVDKWAEGSQEGFRLEVGTNGSLQFVTTAPESTTYQRRLPADKLSQVVAVFSPRSREASIYVNGKLAAENRSDAGRWSVPRTSIALQIGADQDGDNRFHGYIQRLAVFNKALSPAEVSQRFRSPDPIAGLVGEWRLAEGAGEVIPPTVGDDVLMTPVKIAAAQTPSPKPLTLWYRQPACEWVEALPVGNGRLGAMIFGGVEVERLQLNQDTIWAGGPYNPANPAAREAYPKARELIFAGKQKEAEELISRSGMAIPLRQASYSTLGNLLLTFPDRSPVTDYRRTLDLDTAVASTTYAQGGVKYRREVFSSEPDQVIVLRLTADQPASVNFTVDMNTPQSTSSVTANGHRLKLASISNDHAGIPGQVRFESIVEIQNDGGSVTAGPSSLIVSNANAVTLLVSCGTSYVNWQNADGDPSVRAMGDLKQAASKPYAELRERHVQDYQSLFRRVTIDLGTGENALLPTDERVRQFGTGNDSSLAGLFYQFGRYLLISSSRPGTQPANLQGLWNDSTSPPWGGKYTININTEENYWPAETANLPECAEPLFQMVREMAVSGQRTAKTMYGARGWVCHHNTDGWRATAPIDGPGYGMWPTGGAWLTTHLWEHYLFNRDREFLKNAYPIFKGACEFFIDVLVEEPTHHWLVTCPSLSPEHGGVVAGPAMDSQILRDLFAQTAAAAEILGVDPEFRKQVLDIRSRLAPDQIGKYGQLQEWLEDKDREFDSHRHQSHLYAMFPSAQINPSTPNLFEAAIKSLIGRGDISTGWSLGWRINLWARALDGNHAYRLLVNQLTPPKGGSQGGGTYPNLFDAHPPFQIDGNFAAVSGINEMLLQSHLGSVELLPALPKAWPDGAIRGIRARGGFEVDIVWRNGELHSTRVKSLLGLPGTLKYRDDTREINLPKGQSMTWDFHSEDQGLTARK